MFGFSRKKDPRPHRFTLIRNFYKRDSYFIRNAGWGWLEEEKIFIKNYSKAELVTPSPWQQSIFLHANGDRTIEEFVHDAVAQYENREAEAVEQTIIFEIMEMVAAGFISLAGKKQPPPEEFDAPELTAK